MPWRSLAVAPGVGRRSTTDRSPPARFAIHRFALPRVAIQRVTRVHLALIHAALLAAALSAAASAANLTLRVEGQAGAATFEGTVGLSAFAAEESAELAGVGTLSGVLRDAAGERLAVAEDIAVRLPVATGSLRASCDELALRLGPHEVEVGGQRVRLEPIELEVPARAGGAALRELLCALAGRLRSGAPSAEVARALDAVLAALG
jgi:hypothetical protein